MNFNPGPIIGLMLLWIAAGLQAALPTRVAVFGAQPDFILVVLLPLSFISKPSGGLWSGFFAGLLEGGIAGANLAQYIVSRSLSGILGSYSRGFDLDLGFWLAAILTAAGTILAQLTLMFIAPPSAILPYLGATIGTAVYNGVLAIPVYALLRKFFRTRSD